MATTTPQQHRFRNTRFSRFLQARWRLLFATVVCIAVTALLPEDYLVVSRLLMGWDAGVAVYLVLVVTMILRSPPDRLRRDSPLQDEGRIAIPILTVIATMASLGAIVFWLRIARESANT